VLERLASGMTPQRHPARLSRPGTRRPADGAALCRTPNRS